MHGPLLLCIVGLAMEQAVTNIDRTGLESLALGRMAEVHLGSEADLALLSQVSPLHLQQQTSVA